MSLPLRICPGEIHVWPISLAVSDEVHAECCALLTEEELARARQFLHTEHQKRFVAGRGRLRQILSRYLASSPAEVCFWYTSYGKPFLADEAEHLLRFNLSHSADQALLAVTREWSIGVDLERIRPDFATDEIAQRFFSQQECTELRQLPADQRAEAFFRCWTRKEAFIKAIGEGLSYPLDGFAVSLAPGEAAQLRWVRREPEAPKRWHLRELPAPPGFLAALAVEGKVERVVVQSG
jgi:4'-phosphopantetheinyl transferase